LPASRRAGELQRLPAQDRKGAGADCIRLAKHLPRVVAGRIGARRRGPELGLRRHHAVEQARGIDREPGPRQRAQLVAREQQHPAAPARAKERERMLRAICARPEHFPF